LNALHVIAGDMSVSSEMQVFISPFTNIIYLYVDSDTNDPVT